MPFVGNAVGLRRHLAVRRELFESQGLHLDGSHGCVNLPPDRAAALFDIISKGDCVIVHN